MAHEKKGGSKRTFPATSSGTDSTQKKYSDKDNDPALGGGVGADYGFRSKVKRSTKP